MMPSSASNARVARDPLRHHHADFAVEAVRPLVESLTEPLDMDCPTWVMDTNGGYQPGLDSLVAQLVDDLGPHLRSLTIPMGRASGSMLPSSGSG